MTTYVHTYITKSCQGPVGHVAMFGKIIPWQDKTKYLAVFIDKMFSFTPQMDYEYIVATTNGIKLVLAPLMGRRSKISLKNKLLLFRTIILVAMSYVSYPGATSLTKTNFMKSSPDKNSPTSFQGSLVH